MNNNESFRNTLATILGDIKVNTNTCEAWLDKIDKLSVNDGTESLRLAIAEITRASTSAGIALRDFNKNRYLSANNGGQK